MCIISQYCAKCLFFFFSSRRRHTRCSRDWSSDVCSSDLQITRLSPNGHQTPALTSRWDLPAVHVAYRMFERWRQENFFKYARQEYAIDVLVDYKVEPDDPHRSVPNPARKAVQKELRRTRAHLAKLREEYATVPRDLSRLARKRAKKELRAEIQQTTDTIKKLRARHHSLPRRVPVAQTQKEESGETLHRAQAPHRRSEDGRLPSGYC